jgi:hypothetical protein
MVWLIPWYSVIDDPAQVAGMERELRPNGDSRVTKPYRFRFSLATLLLAVVWSAGVVWLNTTPRVMIVKIPEASGKDPLGRPWHQMLIPIAQWGWPWVYAGTFQRRPLPRCPPGITAPWALVGDVAVGSLLVAVLTWASSLLLRRVGIAAFVRKDVPRQARRVVQSSRCVFY